jgi:ribosomal protein L37AE/L43A
MKQAVVALVLVLVLAGGVVAYYLSSNSEESKSISPLDKESEWICLAENDPHDFVLTTRQISQFKDGVVCPTCNSANVQSALACPDCGRHYPAGRYNASPSNCMHCDAVLPGGTISTFHSGGGH